MSHLARPVRLTRWAMIAEEVARRFWPAWTILALVLAFMLTGWAEATPVRWLWGAGGVAVVAFLTAFGIGLRRFRVPGVLEAEARVDARLPGRPIAALRDTLAVGASDGASRYVWDVHLRRMEERSAAARAVPPDLRVSDRDPYGLRHIALLLLSAAFLFGTLWRAPEEAVLLAAEEAVLPTGPAWEGWVEPPAYTGRPSIYLADVPPGLLIVPEGSDITLRFYGEDHGLTLSQTIAEEAAPAAEEAAPEIPGQHRLTVAQTGTLAIEGEGGAAWEIRMIADAPPEVRISGPVEADALGEMSLPFAAEDDYAVMRGRAEIALDISAVTRSHGLTIAPEARDPVIVDLPMPFSGDRGAFEEVLIDDFSEHPFANMPVTVTLTVTDALGQEGISPPEPMILPGRRFFQPIARAVAEQRRDLLWSRENGRRVMMILRAVAHAPEDFFPNETTYLRLDFTLRRLNEMLAEGPLTDEGVAEIAEALWELAVQLEEGSLADARERLARAQERLEEAMRNGASEEEIAELMNELRDAMNEYMRMLAQEAEPQGDGTDEPQTSEGERREITQDEIQALLDRIQELMEEGRMAEAAELMEQLNQLMENLEVTQGDGEGGPQSPGQQSMQELSETLRDQQNLSDDSFRDLQEQFNRGEPQFGQQNQPGQQGQPGQAQPGQQQGEGQSPGANPSGQGQQNDQGQGGEMTPEGSLADRQQALRDELERQRSNLPALAGEEAEAARDALGRAERAMDEAEQALREGDLAEAIDRQAEAMNALRDGIRDLGEALAEADRAPGQGQQEGRDMGRVEPAQRDPLGREMGNSGQLGTDDNMLQDGDVYRRAEEILGEIRRRAGQQDRPDVELDYLKRLLERF